MSVYIAIAIILLVICLSFIDQKSSRKSKGAQNYPFVLRRFLSPQEHKFYQAIKAIADNYGYVIMSKVRLADLVEVKKGINNSEYYSHFAKIKAKHVDFVLCDSDTVTPIAVIEIDDKSHNRPDRIERDKFVDGLFEAVNLPIIHANSIQNLEQQIRQTIAPPQTPLCKQEYPISGDTQK